VLGEPLVLVVDDMPETRRLMRRILERDDMQVVEADTGEDAYAQVIAVRPSAVVLDLRLPGMSGFEVAKRVRAHPDPDIAATTILACSASVQPEVRADALDAGCDDFEGKPFDVATFASRVRDLIRRRTETGLGAGSTI
jgi:CheY-like chemotaxis protein